MQTGNFRVGVFDSGLGGLSVLAACACRLPAARFYYLGDNARAPYGSRPAAEVKELVFQGAQTLAACSVDAVVVACNTATAVCIGELRRAFSFPVLGVEPAVKPAAMRYPSALVLATPVTAASDRLARLIARFPATRFSVAPLARLAAAIEAALPYGKRVDLREHLPPTDCDCVVLGCTHYALLRREIAAFYGKEVFDGAAGTAEELVRRLGIGRNAHSGEIADHVRPPHFLFNENKNHIIFLGNSAELNYNTYFSNICFQ